MDEGFEVRGEFITLGQLLKVLGIAMSGGEAKLLLEEGEFLVNNEVELRRGRKLRPGDVVTFPDGAYLPLIGELPLTPPADAQSRDEAPSNAHDQQGQQAAGEVDRGNQNPPNHRLPQRVRRVRRRPR